MKAFHTYGFLKKLPYITNLTASVRDVLTPLLFIFVTINASPLLAQNGKSYYVDSKNGNDDNNGNTIQQAWKTLNKVNNQPFKSGDNIFFKKGCTFDGQLIIKQSGQAGKNVVYSSYGSGANPIINGLDTLTDWKPLGNGIWETTCLIKDSKLNILLLNNIVTSMGRFPNSDSKNGGYLTFDSHVGNNTITDKNLGNNINWTGAEIVVRRTHWILERGKITSHISNNLTYESKSTIEFKDNYGYFIQNDVRILDRLGEWFYDSEGKKLIMFFGNNEPSKYVVCVPKYNTLVDISASAIMLKGITLQGSNCATISLAKCAGVTISQNNLKFSGKYGIQIAGANITIAGNVIEKSNDIGIKGTFMPSGKVTNNIIDKTGLLPGQGFDYTGIDLYGDDLTVSNNTITNSGYDGIKLDGNNATIKNNVIRGFTSVIDDGGGIYLPGKLFKNRNVLYNIISDGIGAPDGTTKVGNSPSEGIYADDSTSYINIIGNTISNVAGHGIKIHNAHDIVIKGNTLYNNKTQLILDHDKNPNGGLVRNITVTKNTFVPGPATQNTLTLASPTDDVKDYGNIDSNYYVNTTGNSPITVKTSLGQLRDAQLATSITSTIFDKNSKNFALLSPSGNNLKAAPANNVLIKTNKTSKPQTIILGNGTFVDLNGKQYIKSVNLAPFTSLILLKK
ncbi:right-handed parallel beta-helix repeat-containing protein [Mucilaginibacter pallidiroseus]|uniref:Right-handed parallel beta-helix repeat-containing protein n=1 Tax=Mucilaginibacter pallidiroseus TaxID=2599295 RepID=A0A563U8F5_9SPHI|nr:right-handed parallel beta-helix repeat-containing protein [Mucilaginibacter pallidiroseus]TWR27593.1 right-handed parallel beta-helix repeat-containing protein [Mucilaginibacter pallidiroseus]